MKCRRSVAPVSSRLRQQLAPCDGHRPPEGRPRRVAGKGLASGPQLRAPLPSALPQEPREPGPRGGRQAPLRAPASRCLGPAAGAPGPWARVLGRLPGRPLAKPPGARFSRAAEGAEGGCAPRDGAGGSRALQLGRAPRGPRGQPRSRGIPLLPLRPDFISKGGFQVTKRSPPPAAVAPGRAWPLRARRPAPRTAWPRLPAVPTARGGFEEAPAGSRCGPRARHNPGSVCLSAAGGDRCSPTKRVYILCLIVGRTFFSFLQSVYCWTCLSMTQTWKELWEPAAEPMDGTMSKVIVNLNVKQKRRVFKQRTCEGPRGDRGPAAAG